MTGRKRTEGGPVTRFLAADHERLDALLTRAVRRPGTIDVAAFDEFRAGILRHIAIEEKILFPAAREARAGSPHPDWMRLRIDHGAITSLLVPHPTPEIVAEIRSILDPHNALEESPSGLYEGCDELLGAKTAALLERMRNYPPVKVAPYRDGPRVLRRAEDALRLSAKQFENLKSGRLQDGPVHGPVVEEAFTTDDRLYREIVEDSPDAIILGDARGIIRLWNAGAEAVFGFTAAEAVGRSMDIIIPERLRARHWDGYHKVMATGTSRYGRGDLLAVPAIRKDGSTCSIEFTVQVLKDEEGRIVGPVAIIRDVTKRFQREKELARRLKELEAKVQGHSDARPSAVDRG